MLDIDTWTCCALVAGAIAWREGWFADSDRVKKLAYRFYEEELKTPCQS